MGRNCNLLNTQSLINSIDHFEIYDPFLNYLKRRNHCCCILTNIKKSKTVSSITYCQQNKAKETLIIVIQCCCLLWALNSCFPSIPPTTWGIFQKSLNFFQSSLEEGGFRYGSFKTLKMSSQVFLSIRLKVDFPMRYAKNGDCCDFPEARNRSVTASLSPASRRLVSCFVIKDKSSRRRWSYRSGDCSYQSYLIFLWTELHSRIYITEMALSVYQSHFLKISVNSFSLYFQYKGLS